jgi:heat shock protein HtpX
MIKRIFLFLATNMAVIFVLSIVLKILGVQPYLTQRGINYESLLIFSVIFGFGGSFISLLMSKFMAKMAMGVKVITDPRNSEEIWLMNVVKKLAQEAGVGMPDVGIYESPEPNAFATGASRNHALVAVSSGLLQAMTQDEIEAVLGHELSHVANGDMITLTLLQGVLNTFVIFFARIAAYLVSQFLSRDENSAPSEGVYFLVMMVFQIVFGILASLIVMWFSRYREFRADAGSAKMLGREKMIAALKRLEQCYSIPDDKKGESFAAFKISGHSKFGRLFASHPPLQDRINALMK